MSEQDDLDLMRRVGAYLERVNQLHLLELTATRTPLGDEISSHLGADASVLPAVQEVVADHRLVDVDLALAELSRRGGGRLVGVTGGDQRLHSGMAELISSPHARFAPGPVDYLERATGPTGSRRVVSMGVHLFTHRDLPVAVVQRAAARQYGREAAGLEVMGTDPEVVSDLIDAIRRLMVELSVLRGKVLSFVPTEYGHDAGATFLERPEVAESDVILPNGLLDDVVRHALGISGHRRELEAAGQHLKRGILLYGPPGTGKTLTIRHLLSRSDGVTAVLLTGSSIRFIAAAAEIARTFQPSIVVLEDVDLVAMERHSTPQPLLFEVLDALDGLGGDADVAFVMTTNRVDVLERALAERPGRVDLAVEIPLPGLGERRRLLRRYAAQLAFSESALDDAADRTAGTTGSFAKELIRRSVLEAAMREATPGDEDLAAALEALMADREHLTRRMLGAAAEAPAVDASGGDPLSGEEGGFAWRAHP
ncbi:AAA family ATPase [Microbacterium kunmingense]|uniref:AAA family ATPase n=1 Tax=Microbacterium kunmingense TaxID=2915939 RepID=UPI003D70EAAC